MSKRPAGPKTAKKKTAKKKSGKKKSGKKSAALRSAPQKRAATGTKSSGAASSAAASKQIDARIKELGGWRGETLARVRALIRQADPDVVETWKWRGVPVFEHDGIICTGETYKAVVKLTFARGAALDDPAKLSNASLEGNVRRAIDIREGDRINEKALQALVRAAITLNTEKRSSRSSAKH